MILKHQNPKTQTSPQNPKLGKPKNPDPTKPDSSFSSVRCLHAGAQARRSFPLSAPLMSHFLSPLFRRCCCCF
ncbi:hypothetical protein BVRB_9g216170 [Beta vulgaris subsp. vulgaris]|nr:hypothetical protein BVRB_9g216170 [Beta vulgaris subsp. vulgaris]